MKKIFKRTLATIMVVLMLLTSAPLQGFVELEWTEIDFSGVGDWFSSKASAANSNMEKYKIGDTFYFGSYPQTKVSDTKTISKLDSIKKNWKSFNYYSSNMKYADIVYGDAKYRAVTFSEYRKNGQQSKNNYYVNNVYYFKFAPILWQILDPEKGFVTTKYVIDGQPFYDGKYYTKSDIAGMGVYYSDVNNYYYCNNYSKSTIRKWLNEDFYSTAFSNDEATKIVKTSIKNKGWNGNTKYACSDTKDNIFLLSQEEIMNSNYGFNSTNTRKTTSTAYAKAQGSVTFSNGATILLRTAGSSSNWVGAMYNGGGASNQDLFYSTFGIRPAMYLKLSYRETYGWPLANSHGSFGYPQDYEWPAFKRYKEVYGLNISTLLEGGAMEGASKLFNWGGNCFGLALLSLANYHNIIDLKNYFDVNDGYLCDYGYDSIVMYNQGNRHGQYFSVQGNDEVIGLIERALVMQNAVELRSYRVYASDTDFSSLIQHFSSNNPVPLLIRMQPKEGGSHAVVLTGENGVEAEKGMNGWYRINVYDSNTPANSNKLSNPSSVYKYSDPYLSINPSNGKWKYFVGDSYMYESEYDSFWGDDYIEFYDISDLDSSFFTEKLNLWYKKVQLTITIPNITIKSKTGKTLFSMVDNEIKELDKSCDYNVFSAGEDSDNQITFYTDETDLIVYTDGSSQLLGLSEDFYMSADMQASGELSVNFDKKVINSKSTAKGNGENIIVGQDATTDYAIRVEYDSSSGNECELTVKKNESLIYSNTDVTIQEESNNQVPENHYHIFNLDITKTPTCVEKGAGVYTCKCGNSYTVELERSGHKNVTEHQGKSATCLTAGYTEGTYCSDCETWLTGYEVVTSTGHKDNNADGVCDVCKKSFKIVASGKCGQNVTYTLYKNGLMIVKGKGKMYYYDSLLDDSFTKNIADKIKTVIIEKGVTSIGGGSFAACKKLESITIADSVVTIDGYAFGGCTSLTDITIPNGVELIDSDVFWGCENLKNISLPISLNSIGDCSFLGCNNLKTMEYAGTKEMWDNMRYDERFFGEENDCLFSAKLVCTHENSQFRDKQKALCSKSGYSSGLYCPDCESWLDGHKEIPPVKHKYGLYQNDNNATYFSDGTKTAYCENKCGAKDTVTLVGSKLSLGKTSKITATQTTNTVKLTWKSVSGANIYRVYQKSGGSWKKLADVTTLNYTIKNLKAGTKYSFAVKAGAKLNGETIWATTYTTINTATKAVAPSKITATQTASTIKLTWNKVSGATGYRIYYKSGNTWKVTVKSTTATSHTFKNLKAGAKFTFAVKPYIKTDNGNVWSAYKTFTTSTVPANPTAKVTSPSKGKLTVTWSAVKGADSYQLWYKTGNGSYKLYKTYTGAKTLNFKNLKSGTKYTFAVRAVIKTSGGNVRSGYKAVSAKVK